jgi:alpha-tubulin suppressor-like RCC1 family protein
MHVTKPIMAALCVAFAVAPGVARADPDGSTSAAVTAARMDNGGDSSLVVGSDGKVYGQGLNDDGQLTGGSPIKHSLRLFSGLPAGERAVAVSSGGGHTVVLTASGKIYGTGDGDFGQLANAAAGDDDPATLRRMTAGLPAGTRIKAIAAEGLSTLVLTRSGRAYSTGDNSFNKLGRIDRRPLFKPVGGLPARYEVVSMSVSLWHTLFVTKSGLVFGRGSNIAGQLTGGSDVVRTMKRLPVPLARAVVASSSTSLVLGRNGQVYGAGANVNCMLTGDADYKRSFRPLVGLPAGVKATRIAMSRNHVLVVGSDGRAYGTGYNNRGALTGPGYEHCRFHRLSSLPRGVRATGVAATDGTDGQNFSLVRGSNGQVYGAGYNIWDQILAVPRLEIRTLTRLRGLPS